MISTLQTLLGSPTNTVHEYSEVVDTVNGVGVAVSQVIEYDLEYICGFILVVLFSVGIFKLVSNFQKSFKFGGRS